MPRRGENIHKRKDGLWEARYPKGVDVNGKKKYGSVYARSYREVKEKRQTVLDNLLLYQKPVSPRNMTVSSLVTEWLKINKNRLKPSTYQRYCGLYKNHIESCIGSWNVIYLTTALIQDYAIKRRENGLSERSVNAVLAFLHSCLKYGQRQYRLPMPEIIYFSFQMKEMRVLSCAEQKLLEQHLLRDMDVCKFGVLLTLYTGLRIGELCALRWEDFDSDCIKVRRTVQRLRKENEKKTELHIGPPKTSKSMREIPLPAFLIPIVEEFRANAHPSSYVLGGYDTPDIEPRVMQNKFKKYLKEAGIEAATFHSLRHTFATRCVESGFEIKTLSEILGHTNVQTTLNLYVHTSKEIKRENMNKLRPMS